MRRDQLTIAEPCHEDWTSMTGDERRRFCGSCNKHVHDLSAMDEDEAEELLGTEGEVCVRYEVDTEGRVVHRSARRRVLKGVLAATLAATTPAWASGAVQADTGWFDRLVDWAKQALEDHPIPVMGQMVAPVPVEVTEVLMGDVVFEPEPQPLELTSEHPTAVMGRVRATE